MTQNTSQAVSRISKWKAVAIGVLGAFFCVGLVIAPDALSAWVGHPGKVWTPVNSPLYRYGDAYYYAAWVANTVHDGIPPYSPSAVELSKTPLIETLRWFPLAVAALPSLLISDFRYVFVVDYIFTATVLFGVPFLLGLILLRSATAGLVAGVVVLFGTGQWWSALPEAPTLWGNGSVAGWLGTLKDFFFVRSFTSFFQIVEVEALQGSFRYINNSISQPLLLLYCLGCFLIARTPRPSWILTLIVIVASPLFAFSYPSHPPIAYSVLLGSAAWAFIERRRRTGVLMLTIVILTAIVLMAGGYVEFQRKVFSSSEIWREVFQRNTFEFIHRSLIANVKLVVINKYTLSLVIALALSWRNRELRVLVLGTGLLACALMLSTLFNAPDFWSRFLARGIDHLWMTCMVLALICGWQHYILRPLPNGGISPISRAVTAIVVAAVLFVPARGFGEYAFASAHTLTRTMPVRRWEALQWINKNLPPGSVLGAINWDDITFIPIYTRSNLVVGNMILDGRTPKSEIAHYVALWKVLGFERARLRARLNSATSAIQRLNSPPAVLRRPPFVDGETYASGQIAEAVIYWPYVKTVHGIRFAGDKNEVTPEFTNWVMSIFDGMDALAERKKYHVDYVVLSGVERDMPVHFPVKSRLMFSNETHRIFKLDE